MRVTIYNGHSLAAVLIGTPAFALIALAAVAVVADGFGRLGVALLMFACVVWLHGQINRIVERMSSREDAAFTFGKLSAVRDVRENHR